MIVLHGFSFYFAGLGRFLSEVMLFTVCLLGLCLVVAGLSQMSHFVIFQNGVFRCYLLVRKDERCRTLGNFGSF